MAWMACRGCSAKFAVGLLRCPQCQAVSERYAVPEEIFDAEQEAAVPKITVAAGPSNSLDTEGEAATVAEVPSAKPAQTPAESVSTERPDTALSTAPDGEETAPEQPDAKPAPKRRGAAKKAAAPEADAGK